MAEVVLCDGTVKISIRPDQKAATLCIAKGDEFLFPMSRKNIKDIIDGETLQFSVKGIFCKLSRQFDQIRIVYAWQGAHDSSACPVNLIEDLLTSLEA